ncbi:hypothetical protein BABINDRAFT_163321 [Babjeviella inositovora NRRL Y-12698]|uniref:tRNA-binding domain-containing protein n=1 Tax=Babjeviella inositovora NRRL Y-12698 TaxID=984486 RepID=A0A1E3QIW0_9ASCO|nr:uncharacterized protein BABINDRAFT_163321 [Babjeviella inositovora NRRL Y-12698]ODQ77590.1 hypothetical protein BABINDRAFT_163321 [Babjeviella inositovora NRRL Y-12698]
MFARFTSRAVYNASKTPVRFISAVPEHLPSLLNLKVGQIVSCEKHPDAEKLYVSRIQVGTDGTEANLLTVCSGLVQFVPLDQMQGRRVVVLTNLKPSKMRGIKSEAMLLASEAEVAGSVKVELVDAPRSSLVGESLYFKPFVRGKNENPPRLKSKVWELIQANLKTNQSCEVVFNNDGEDCFLLTVSGERATVASLRGSTVR